MEEDEDDLYGRSNGFKVEDADSKTDIKPEVAPLNVDGANDDDDSDSEIEIVTERPPNSITPSQTQHAKPPPQLKHERAPSTSNIEPPAKRPSTSTPRPESATAAAGANASTPVAKASPADQLKSGSEYPEVRVSTADLDANPPYESTGKPVTGLDIDADLAEKEKPWRRPGQDQSDYFNYGFDEFTWTQYCLKQGKLRAEVAGLNAEKDSMLGGPTGATGAMPGMDGMGMSQEDMQQFMQMMGGQGGDMGQMEQFAAMMGGMPGGMGAGGFNQQGMMEAHGPQPPTGPSGHRNQFGGRGRGRRW